MNLRHLLPLALLLLGQNTTQGEDFADLANKDAWLVHPVYGDASFDNFVHGDHNPVVRGKAPLEWPVNGFLFEDPVSRHWFLFVGHYPRGYAMVEEAPFQCTVMESADHGKTWKDLGPIFPDEPHHFTGETSPTWYAPDVSVTHADGRYHLAYDWATKNTAWGSAHDPGPDANNGAGYAWADSPAGPYHRTATPIADTRSQTTLLGKYRRIYASTILRRADDWLFLILTDSGPSFGWGYLAVRARQPEGPYTDPVLVLHPEVDTFHPPLMEFHPSFIHDGYVYAPATSVARNRNFQALWRAPLEQAHDPAAWQLTEQGSLWHAEPRAEEHDGIWGQAFSGFVDAEGTFNVMFPSRDAEGMGLINLAARPWNQPHRQQGFVISGHQGPSMVRLKRSGPFDRLEAALELRGTATLMWNARGPLAPDQPQSDATLHPRMRTDYAGLELQETAWTLVEYNAAGERRMTAQGGLDAQSPRRILLETGSTGDATLSIDDHKVYSGPITQGGGTFGLLVEANSHLKVNRFDLQGAQSTAAFQYLCTEALLNAAQNLSGWQIQEDPAFTYGLGAVSQTPGTMAKWNFDGGSIRLYAPTGPQYGQAEVRLDGTPAGTIDFHSDTPQAAARRLTLENLGKGFHALTLRPIKGSIPIDHAEVGYGKESQTLP